jgi:cell division protein FtsA
MLNDNYICALDISSSKIAAVVAQLKGRRINSVFFDTAPSRGIKQGIVLNSVDLISALSSFLKSLKTKSGINIKYVYANISGQDVITKHSRAIIPLTGRGNKVITQSDIEKVNEQARILGSSLEEEIIHSLPFSYAIDSKEGIDNPLGQYSHRLESDLYLVCAKLPSVETLTRVVHQAGYEIKNLFFSGIATSAALFNKDSQKGVNVICDIGSDITDILVFKDGMLKNIEVLPLGGNDLTLQLEDALKIPLELAEDLKRSYASIGDYSQIEEDKEILIKRDNLYKPIKQKIISEIMTSKSKIICQGIKERLENIVSLDEVDNFMAVGRSVLMEGFLEALENTLGISVKLGRISRPEVFSLLGKYDAVSGQKYLTYLTSLGIVCQAMDEEKPWPLSFAHPAGNPILKAINKVREVYQEYF